MNPRLSILCLFCLSSAAPAAATPVQWTAGSGHFYELVASPISWSEALISAQSSLLGGTPGHLATVTSSSEEDFILQSFGSVPLQTGGGVWIGLSDAAQEGTFVWVTGEALSYTNWQSGEPNGGTFENFGETVFFGGGTSSGWNDLPGSSVRGYLIEWDTTVLPEPGTALLVAVGALVLGSWRSAIRRLP